MDNPPYVFWSIWRELSLLQHLFFLILFAVSIYSLYSVALIMVRIRSIIKCCQIEDASSLQHSLTALHNRSANVRQLIGATFYLFGFIFFQGLPFAFNTLGLSKTPGWVYVLENLRLDFVFAANVFLIFLILHLIQWFVLNRLHSCVLRLNTRHTA